MDYSTWKHLNDNDYRPVEYIYKPDNFSNPDFGLGIIAYGNKYGLEVKMQASQEDVDYAMSGHQLQICGYRGLKKIDNLPYQNVCMIYIRHNDGYYLGRQYNRGWYTMPDGTIVDNSNASPLITPCDTAIHIVSTYYDSESNTIKTFLDGVLKANDGSSKTCENDLTAGTEYFVYGNGSSGGYSFKGRIYYIKTFDDERNVTGHFIPCVRKSDGRAGLYDIVNSVFKVSTYDYIKAGPYPGQRLPYDYIEVEYIKNNSSSGGIDTGMKMSITDYTVEAKFKQDDISNGMPLGTGRQDNGTLWFYNYTAETHNEFAVYANYISGWKVAKRLWKPCNTDIHTVKFEGNSTGCDISWDSGNTQTGTYTTPQQYSTDNLFVFGRDANWDCYYGRIYYVKLWNTETGAMLFDYVPCVRMSDNTPGFYDLVSNEFKTITDAATKWEAGPDIITEQIPWAVGTGNIRLTYIGVGDGTIIAESDENNIDVSRSQQVTVETTKGTPVQTKTLTVNQSAGPNFRLYGGDILRLADGNYLSVAIPNN